MTGPDIFRQKWTEYLTCLRITLQFEGGKVDDPDDPGGRTAYGVTQRVYSAWLRSRNLKEQDVWKITMPSVEAIYHKNYWALSGAIFQPWPMSLLVFDAAVNHGVRRAVAFLGSSHGNPVVYLDTRVAFYHAIVRNRPTSKKYLRGWLRRADILRQKCLPGVASLEEVAAQAKAA